MESEAKAADFQDYCEDLDDIKASASLKSSEHKNLQANVEFLKQEIAKIRNYENKTSHSIALTKDQCYEAEGYLRSLGLQERKQSEHLNAISDENDSIHKINADLIQLIEVSREKIRE